MDKKPKVVIFVNGGLVQNILTNEPMQVFVIDSDVEGCDEVRRIREWGFDKNRPDDRAAALYDVFDGGEWEPNVNPEAADYYFEQMLREVEE